MSDFRPHPPELGQGNKKLGVGPTTCSAVTKAVRTLGCGPSSGLDYTRDPCGG